MTSKEHSTQVKWTTFRICLCCFESQWGVMLFWTHGNSLYGPKTVSIACKVPVLKVSSEDQIWERKKKKTYQTWVECEQSLKQPFKHLNSLSKTTSRFHVTDTTGCVEWLEQTAVPVRTQLHSLRLVTWAPTLSLRWKVKVGFWQTAFLCFPPFFTRNE